MNHGGWTGERSKAFSTLMDGKAMGSYLRNEHKGQCTQLDVLSPYFSKAGADLLETMLPKRKKAHLRLIVRRDLASVVTGALDLDAIDGLIGLPKARKNLTVEVKWLTDLHSKLIVATPGKIAILGSSNMSAGGIEGGNLELNVLWKGSGNTFSELAQYFEVLWEDEVVGDLDEEALDNVRRICTLPPVKALKAAYDYSGFGLRKLEPLCLKDRRGRTDTEYLRTLRAQMLRPQDWKTLVKQVKSIAKKPPKGNGDSSAERDILFLLNHGILEVVRKERIRFSARGQRVLDDQLEAYKWMCEVDPITRDLLELCSRETRLTIKDMEEKLAAAVQERGMVGKALAERIDSARSWLISDKLMKGDKWTKGSKRAKGSLEQFAITEDGRKALSAHRH